MPPFTLYLSTLTSLSRDKSTFIFAYYVIRS